MTRDLTAKTPQRIQRKRGKGWRMPKGAVYVGRLPKGLAGWGNPFVVGTPDNGGNLTRAEAVRQYRTALLEGRLQYSVAQVRAELAGRDLACWCPLEDEHGQRVPCHADVLLDVANS